MAHHTVAVLHQRVRNLIDRLARLVLKPEPVVFTARCARTTEPVPAKDRHQLDYRPITCGEQWGATWDSGWFHLTAEVPAAWAGDELVARIDLAGEILVLGDDGEPRCGLTDGSVFSNGYSKDVLHLGRTAQGGERIDIWCEAAANGLFGVQRTDPEHELSWKPLHGVHRGEVRAMHLHRFDRAVWQLWLDFEVLENLYGALPEASANRARLLRGMDRAVSAFERGGVAAARAELAPLWAVGADPGQRPVTGVGHAHIDTAWMWPICETVRKTARTFASQLDLIARYPGYVFGASQAQLYAFVQEHYPALHQRVRAAVAAGRWEVQGGMWVEADCNLPSGESLVRQFVHGKRWFMEAFGVEPKNLWLPDVFGYSGQLPQILQQSGCPYFLTQKLSWNRTNTFPHNTFLWRGIDGSEVVAHFPPENDYNSGVYPKALVHALDRDKEKAFIDEAICLFGIGDGGGGPKEEHLERALRLSSLNGCPPFRFGAAQPALERLGRHRAELATWQGELYFEAHRATFTTQAAMKRANRRAEEALRLAEALAACRPAAAWPRAELDRHWKTVLTNQFHDIIPGSSIHRVYEEAVPQDEAVATWCLDHARSAGVAMGRADAEVCSWVNVSSTPFDDLVALPAGWTGAEDAAGKTLPALRDGDTLRVRLMVPAQGFAGLRRVSVPAAVTAAWRVASDADLVLENTHARYRFDRNGRLVEALDHASGRPLMQPGMLGNDLAIYEDRPHWHDAWDLDEQFVAARLGGLTVTAITRCDSTLGVSLRVSGRIGASTVTQEIRLAAHHARLDFITEVQWNERHKVLRTLFATDVVAAEAACEIQYGHVRRPTHRNTSWDAARFEVCAHRWVDLSERRRGVALLNDCKYGYSILGGELGLTLLRAPTDPDPVADIGQHRFTYALLPHAGDLHESPVLAHAAMLNQGIFALPGSDCRGVAFPIRLDGDGAELAVLKRAEDGDDLIVRVVETRGDRAQVNLRGPAGVDFIPCDLLERPTGPACGRSDATIALGPFAIRTFRLANGGPA